MVIDTSTIVVICSVITSVAGAGAVINKSIKKWSDKVTDKLKEDIKKEVGADMDIMKKEFEEKYSSAVADFNAKLDIVVNAMTETKQYRSKRENDEKKFRLATLKGHIVSAHGTYVPIGKIDTHVLSTLEDIYDEYKELGGNHFVDNLMEDLRKLQKI